MHQAEEGGYWAEVPALPGCGTEAYTYEELIANLKDAIVLYLSDDDEADKEAKADNWQVVDIAI